MHTTIDTPDIQLAKILIARKLKDNGVDLNPDKLVATIKEDGARMPRSVFAILSARSGSACNPS